MVCDLVYRADGARTGLLAEAERRGARTVDGLAVLVGQGARSFRLFTGADAPVAVMDAAARGARMRTLITGGSGGIGLALARICARHGHDLVLVARSEELLAAAQAELRDAAHASTSRSWPADLARAQASVERVAELHPDVDALVNNAGFGMSGPLAERGPGSCSRCSG